MSATPRALHDEGLALERAGRLDEALDRIGRAVDLAPEDAGLRNSFGLVLARLGESAAATSAFRTALALAGSMPPYLAAPSATGAGAAAARGRPAAADRAGLVRQSGKRSDLVLAHAGRIVGIGLGHEQIGMHLLHQPSGELAAAGHDQLGADQPVAEAQRLLEHIEHEDVRQQRRDIGRVERRPARQQIGCRFARLPIVMNRGDPGC
jgi:tetratricopeptide (TPR) repeat protein